VSEKEIKPVWQGSIVSESAITQTKMSFALRDEIIECIADFMGRQDESLEVAEHVIWLAMTDVLIHTGKVLGQLRGEEDRL